MSFAAVAGAAVAVGGSYLLNKDNNDRASKANESASDSAALTAQIGAEQWDRYNELYDPLERQFVDEAKNYDSPERYSQAAGEAAATVAQQFGKARERLGRTPGLDPSSPAFAASMTGLDLAQAATDATQQNAARQRVKDTAYVRKTDALSLGKGLPAQASNMLSSATRTNLGLADLSTASGMANSNAIGNVVNRVINPTNVQRFTNWRNPSSGVSQASLDIANASSDPIGSLITTEGW